MFIHTILQAFSPESPRTLTPLQLLNAWAPPIVWAVTIYLFSANSVLPGFSESLPDFVFKKSAHMFVYAVLYLLIHRALCLGLHTKSTTLRWKIAVFVCMIYALTDEFHQMLVPGRYGTFRDIGFDMLGVTTVLLKQHKYL